VTLALPLYRAENRCLLSVWCGVGQMRRETRPWPAERRAPDPPVDAPGCADPDLGPVCSRVGPVTRRAPGAGTPGRIIGGARFAGMTWSATAPAVGPAMALLLLLGRVLAVRPQPVVHIALPAALATAP